MPGGLIQIATYGAQDLFLTGTPEITFFKVVYRRHTNFAIESVRIPFDDAVGFGLTSCVTAPKMADLIHKAYLEVELPRMDLKRNIIPDNGNIALAQQEAADDFQKVINFMSLNRRSYVGANSFNESENTLTAEKLINVVQEIFTDPNAINVIDAFKELLTITPLVPYEYDEISMDSIAALFEDSDPKGPLFDAMTVGINKSIVLQNFYFKRLREANTALEESQDDNVKFAWVNRVGHAIFESIEIQIGGCRIDKHYSDWVNIWYELTANRSMESAYMKMIGNVPELTTFNRDEKPKYLLRIPLQFWFCRYSGLAIPLIGLEYHDISFNVKFRNLKDVAYIQQGETIKYIDDENGLLLDEVPCELGINLQAYLLLDYIFLDSPERRRFAQSSHEYLIEQVQQIEVINVDKQQLQCILDSFVHPSKEIVWVAQKKEFIENLDGYNQNRWDNYSLTPEGVGNPILYSTLDFNSYNRVPRLDSNYFGNLQPWEAHNTTPSDGINVYSFAIYPEEHQPSSTANFSRIPRASLTLEFSPTLFPTDSAPIPFDVRIYTRNTNILRFLNGLAGLAFTYG